MRRWKSCESSIRFANHRRALRCSSGNGCVLRKTPDTYLVITPLSDSFELHADNAPGCETQEARLSLFTKGGYTKLKNDLVRALLGADFYITDRRYIGFEAETGYHHYAIDVAQIYELEE